MAPKEPDFLEIAHQRAIEKKTHVSFPKLKYPSLRDSGVRDPIQWLEGKAMDDGAEGIWRVHDGLYDLSDFVKRHPGGAEWLELTKGLDITEAFECHHLDPNVENILSKFYVRDAKTPRNSPFTFKDDGFYRSLKRAVREELKKIPKNVPRYADMIIDSLFATLLFASALACWATNYWVVMASYLVASLMLAWLTVAAHNYIHKKTNWRMYLFNFSLWSYRDFRVSHALSHHVYPNTLMDLEISGFEPIVFWLPKRNVPPTAKLAILIEQIVFPFIFIKNFLTRFLSVFFRRNFLTKHYRWHDGIGFLLPLWMYLVSGASFYEAVVMWLWIVCTGSFIFFTIGSNAAHYHPRAFKDGDEPRDENPDWGVHEVEAVLDRKDINANLFKVMTFFGDHTLHHLFPTLDHSVLSYLYPVFLEHCKKYKAQYKLSDSWDLFLGQIEATLKTDGRTLEEQNKDK